MTTLNVGLQVLGVGLVSTGVATIGTSLFAGAVEIILGIGCYLAYELTPVK